MQKLKGFLLAAICYIFYLSIQAKENYFYSHNKGLNYTIFIVDLITYVLSAIFIYFVFSKKRVYLKRNIYFLCIALLVISLMLTHKDLVVSSWYFKIIYIIKYIIIMLTLRIKRKEI